jgi:REP element-mobilizing transposase RayT
MTAGNGKHLRRLDRVFSRAPIYFVTTVVANRKPCLLDGAVQNVAEQVWQNTRIHSCWSTGSYILMPDHVHFICRPCCENAVSLSQFVGSWKQWTTKYLKRDHGFEAPFWQPEFFDHVLRSKDSFREKLDYLKNNPVRAGLVEHSDDWSYQGNIDNWEIL